MNYLNDEEFIFSLESELLRQWFDSDPYYFPEVSIFVMNWLEGLNQ